MSTRKNTIAVRLYLQWFADTVFFIAEKYLIIKMAESIYITGLWRLEIVSFAKILIYIIAVSVVIACV